MSIALALSYISSFCIPGQNITLKHMNKNKDKVKLSPVVPRFIPKLRLRNSANSC